MKVLLLLTLPIFLVSSLSALEVAVDIKDKPIAEAEAKAEAGMLRHIVMFKFKAEATDEQTVAIEKAFGELPKKINTIKGYEWGTNISKENKSQGFTHCFVVTFTDQKGLDIYTPHAAHQAFVKQLLPILDKVLVLDFIAQ